MTDLTFLLILVGFVATVWVGALFLRADTAAVCVLALAAGICFGYPFARFEVGPIAITADRVLWILLLAHAAYKARLKKRLRLPLNAADRTLLLVMAIFLASTLLHDFHFQSFRPVSKLVFFWGLPLGYYWAMRSCPVSQKSLTWLLGFVAALGLYLAIVAIAETTGAHWLVFPRYILSPQWPEFLGRARGPLLNPIGTGILLSVALAQFVAIFWLAKGGKRLLALAVACVVAIGVAATLTRSVWLGAIAVLAGVSFLCIPPPRRWLVPIVGLMACVVAATLLGDHLLAIKRDRYLNASAAADSVKLRPLLAAVAWKIISDKPVFGCGFGQYDKAKVDYIADRSLDLPLERTRPYEQHNVFLAIGTETGLLGLTVFCILLGHWIAMSWSVWRHAAEQKEKLFALLVLALLLIYIINGLFHDVSVIRMINAVVFAFMGAVRGLLHSCNKHTGPLSTPSNDSHEAIQRPEHCPPLVGATS